MIRVHWWFSEVVGDLTGIKEHFHFRSTPTNISSNFRLKTLTNEYPIVLATHSDQKNNVTVITRFIHESSGHCQFQIHIGSLSKGPK